MVFLGAHTCKCVTEACICSMSVTLDAVTVSFRK